MSQRKDTIYTAYVFYFKQLKLLNNDCLIYFAGILKGFPTKKKTQGASRISGIAYKHHEFLFEYRQKPRRLWDQNSWPCLFEFLP